MQQLVFGYESTARIRFKKENCYFNEDKPYVYRIITEKLDFLIPRRMVIMSKEHVYIPKGFYMRVLDKFYQNISA